MRISDWSSDVCSSDLAAVVERLGKFDRTLSPGLGFTVPFLEKVAYRHSLKEMVLDVASQVCITKDNTQLKVDGVLYYQVTDPRQASYGSANYVLAITNLAQTSLRSVIGKLEMDETFEKRSEEQTSELQSLMRISYAVFCLTKKKQN